MRQLPSAPALAAVTALVCSCGNGSAPDPGQRAAAVNLAGKADFKVVTTGLGDPYELLQGPDGHLWLTERAVRAKGGKGGVLGLALHPDFGKWIPPRLS
ncbi:hypothetical protein [Streptomyces sp. 4F14]|uniref:hypothetical protein n=1 Tax=Streptomyces sp. 4F14 TaxID=3394380 RepID=UPI003A8AB771